MRRILVPTDGSANSLRALRYAGAQAKHGPVEIHLVNVQPPLDDYGMVSAYMSRKDHTRAMKVRAESLLRRVSREIGAGGVRCKAHAAIGAVAPTVVGLARRLRCESIVMGTRGMGSVGNLLLGSVASKVVHLSTVPVTLVK